MTQEQSPKSPPQQPEPPSRNNARGERRPPLGSVGKYDKHGGNIDHDGKPAKTLGTPEPPKHDERRPRNEC
jgi:hypothetical protein